MKSFVPVLSFIVLSILLSSCGIRGGILDRSGGGPTGSEAEGEKIEEGVASWYGPNFHGNPTANGETYDMDAMTAAHRTLPFNTRVRVVNKDNGESTVVRINDRGPFAKNRIIDLSRRAASEIDMINAGTAEVELYMVEGDLENSRTTDLKRATYTVQLASFSNKDSAQDHSRKISGSRVEEVTIDNRQAFRVYYGEFTDKAEAQEAYEKLKEQGFIGYVKQLEN